MAVSAKMANMQALLKWSIAQETGSGASASADGGSPAAAAADDNEAAPPMAPLDKDRQTFLDKVLAQLSVSVVDEMEEIFRRVKGPDGEGGAGEDEDDKVEALEALSDLIEDIDNSTDFLKIGGVGICYYALKSKADSVRAAALGCLAVAAQNNPAVQAHLHQTGLPERLADIFADHNANGGPGGALHVQAVRTLSSYLRGQSDLVQAWIKDGGVASLAAVVQAAAQPSVRFVVKVAHLVGLLPTDFPAFREAALKAGLLAAVVGFVTADYADDAIWEHSTYAMLRLATDHPAAAAFLVDCGIPDIVRKRRAELTAERSAEDLDCVEEEMRYGSELLALWP